MAGIMMRSRRLAPLPAPTEVLVKTERPDACRVAAWMALLDAHSRLTGRLEAELERGHGIILAEYEVLYRLSQAREQRLRLHELTAHTRMTKSGVSRLVDRMQQRGLISTERCPSDRRGAFAVITQEGRAVFRRAAALHLRGVQDHFGRHLDDDEAAALRVTLERVRDALPPSDCSGASPAPVEAVSL
jgi:DNA-binding MarR family transcriptional regulator